LNAQGYRTLAYSGYGRAHMTHNVHTEADAHRLAELVGQAYRYQGSIYALVSTVRDYPLAGQEYEQPAVVAARLTQFFPTVEAKA
jgi:hypothetical protein